MRFQAKNVPFDPVPMFDDRVAGAAGGTCNNAYCNWRADLGNRARALVPARLQVMPIPRGAHGSASSGSGDTAGCETGTGPASLAQNLVVMMPLCAIT